MNEQTETEIAEQAVAEVIADSVGFEGSQVAVPKAVSTKDEEVADGEVRRSKRSKKLFRGVCLRSTDRSRSLIPETRAALPP